MLQTPVCVGGGQKFFVLEPNENSDAELESQGYLFEQDFSDLNLFV